MKQRAFTIAELMISLALFSLIAVGLSWLVLSASRAQNGSAQVNGAQNAVRAAMASLRSDIQMASAGVSSGTLYDWRSTIGNTTVSPIDAENHSDGPDRITLLTVEGGMRGMVINPFFAASASGFDTLLNVDSVGLPAATLGIPANSVILISDLATGYLLKLNAATVLYNSNQWLWFGIANPANPSSLPSQIREGSYVFKSRWVTYSIDTSTNPPMLMIDPDGPGTATPEPIAEGVEDLQIVLGFDQNGNGVIESPIGTAADDDEWAFNVAGEAQPALAKVRQVSVSITARTPMPESATAQVPRFGGDRAAGNTADRYLRRTVTEVITIRSFSL